ncbi:phage tail spike protein [Mammaliicoccus sciuri]|uniref:phage tail spike protein n=1 Tax=Mammaliicoccus sciuri TaxID=1296 RepID=UPI003F54F1D1
MIHVLDFNSKIIDFISSDDIAVTRAEYTRNKQDKSELLNIEILSERAEHFKKRNRVIIQDKTNAYREFIINRIEESGDILEVECDPSYVEDIGKAKPIPAGNFTKMTVNEALSETLRDSGWVEGLCEYGGIKSMSWTSVRTPYEMISQLTTTYKLEPDYEIEIDGNEVVKRKVNMLEPKPLFKGKEIVYGKDLISMKRTVDMTEVKTALYAEGPEKEDGSRISVAIVDKNAQEQFGLPNRFLWGFYEPESDDQNMTIERLTTLTKTELNKRNSAALSYEIEAFDLEKDYPHEIIRFGDIVRIKNTDFTPSLYAESEVIGFTHELISGELTWTFGNIVEYEEDDLLKYFRSRLKDIEKKFNDDINNVGSIITDRIDEEVERLQRKLHRGSTPPDNPEEGDFWFDTSNPNVAVLREFVNGEWKHASAHDVEQIGGLSREVIIYRQVLEATHSMSAEIANQMERTNVALSSEYLVDLDVKGKLQKALSDMLAKLQIVQNYMDSMTEETATIGRLMEWQSALVDLRNDFYYLIVALIEAEKAIQERLKYLQSQYTEEKFNEAMQNVADKFGFEYTEDGFLVGEGSLISGAIQALREDTEEQFKQVVKSVDYETDKKGIIERLNGADSAREQLDKLIRDRVTLTEYNKMKIGTENLLLNSLYQDKATSSSLTHAFFRYYLTTPLKVGKTYTFTCNFNTTDTNQSGRTSVRGYSPDNGLIDVDIVEGKIKVTFVAKVASTTFLVYKDVAGTSAHTLNVNVTNALLVEGNKIGDYSQAPKEQEERLETMETSIEQNGKDIKLKASEEEFNKTKQTLSKIATEILMNTTTGVTISYDDNGNVNDVNVGPEGVKINTDVFEINDGDVIVKDGVTTIKEAYIDKLFSNKATIDYLNSVDITAKRIQAVDNKATVNIENGVITMNRTDGHKLDIGINGMAMVNPDGSKRFSIDRLLVTSAALGTSNSNVYLVAQQGFEVRAVDITQIPSDGAWDSYRYVPVRALAFVGNKLMTNGGTNLYLGTDAEVRVTARGGYNGDDTVYRNMRALGYYGDFIETNSVTSGVNIYIRPDSNAEVRFTSKGTTDNYVDIRAKNVYGSSLISRDSGNLYLGTDDGIRVTGKSLYNGGSPIWRNLAANGLYANFLDINPNTNAVNLYLRADGEVRITKRNTTDSYIPIRAASATWTSSERYKYDIENWDIDVLEHLVDRVQLYSYKLYSEMEEDSQRVRHGVVLERETPDEWKNGDGVDSYEMTAWCLKAIQELTKKVRTLETELEAKL